MKALLTVLLLLALQQDAYSAECDTTLKETDTYQELSIILNCFSRKIQKLEQDMAMLRQSGGQNAESQEQAVLLDNKVLSVYGLKVSKRNDAILVSFIIKSKSDQDIPLSVIDGSPIVTDEYGASSSDSRVTGMACLNKNNPYVNDYTVINPGVPTPVSISFSIKDIKGNVLSLRVGLQQIFEKEKYAYYSFGKTDITLN